MDVNDSITDAELRADPIACLLEGFPHLTHCFVRSVESGVDHIVAIYRCHFEPGEQLVVVHVPIYPAFEEIPEVEAICLDGNARIRVTDRQKFGIRLEVIHSSPMPGRVCEIIEVVARAPGPAPATPAP
jgi:hypothetical protein